MTPAEVIASDTPIALCGFMGVGKSVIGRSLAKELGRAFYDTDGEVTRRLGCQIPELFASGDETLFRQSEAAMIAELVHRRPAGVLALGGGALENPATLQLLCEQALLVHLDQAWTDLWPALQHLRVARPLLVDRSEDEVRQLFDSRQASYARAHVRVLTTRRGVRSTMHSVLHAIEAHETESPTR